MDMFSRQKSQDCSMNIKYKANSPKTPRIKRLKNSNLRVSPANTIKQYLTSRDAAANRRPGGNHMITNKYCSQPETSLEIKGQNKDVRSHSQLAVVCESRNAAEEVPLEKVNQT